MKTKIFLTSILLVLLMPVTLLAAMQDYCSAPPYVSRTVAPNIMVLMDNSADMMTPANSGDYVPNATNDNYSGYFTPDACYAYNQKFYIPIGGGEDGAGNCLATSPYRGNLLNWATTSKYDLLQKVLIGGNTVSKQGNAHTVLAIGGTFPERTYNGCVFRYNNGNLSITETAQDGCSLLNPVGGFASLNPFKNFNAIFTRGVTVGIESLIDGVARVGKIGLSLVADVHLVSNAWASTLNPISVAGTYNTKTGLDYSITFTGSGDNNDVYSWSFTGLPGWLSGPVLSTPPNSNRTDSIAKLSGRPTIAGEYTFTVTLSHRDGSDIQVLSVTILVEPEPLRIITQETTLNPLLDNPFSFTMQATEGLPFANDGHTAANHYHWTWAAITGALPPGLWINGVTGEISGTPTVAGTYNVRVTAKDRLSTADSSTWRTKDLVIVVAASSPLQIITDSLTIGTKGQQYLSFIDAAGGTKPYVWTQTGLPTDPNLGFYSCYGAGCSSYIYAPNGPTLSGSYPVTITVRDSKGATDSKTFNYVVTDPSSGPLEIITPSPLPSAELNTMYYVSFAVNGGTPPYTSATITGQSPATPVMSLVKTTGSWRISAWTPNQLGTYTFTLNVWDSAGASVSKVFTVDVLRRVTLRQQSFNVKVDLHEDPLTDLNGNGIWDLGEAYTDADGNGVWNGKQGVFQRFWDANNPKARWGLTMYREQGATTVISVSACIPAAPASSYFTNVQNATGVDNSTLASEMYGAINYFGFVNPYGSNSGANFTGCTNSDPIDSVPCRKNFLLVISSGSNVGGTAFPATTDCSYTDPAVQNACYGYKTDLRGVEATKQNNGKQNVYTYVVNTMGTANNDILQEMARVGGGGYYDASDARSMEQQLTNALQDILSQAASGTAVSVLTTSSRGIGSMMQAYFLPVRLQGDREVRWTGYAQNIWIDPTDNLREDTNPDYNLKLDDDRIVKLYFDTASNQTKAARFTTDGALACTEEDIRDFDSISYTWEGGKMLALQRPSSRTLFTATKVVYGNGSTYSPTFTPDTGKNFPEFKTDMNASLLSALGANTSDPEVPFSAENIVRYVRGECLETSVNGDTACGGTPNGVFRDRRIEVKNAAGSNIGDSYGNVWKLGDIISSTPKVLANTPVNTYHIDYGDSTYFSYVSSPAYKKRSAVSFIGANDGVLHAFRVGYMKDKDDENGSLGSGVKAVIKNLFASSDGDHSDVGKEVWGYVPYNSFPYLKYLANPDYCHMYFNDLSVRLVDASLGCDPTLDSTCDGATEPRTHKVVSGQTVSSWRTIVIGGMRYGGACNGGLPAPPTAGVGYSSYYAIDVTDAENPKPLWEFSDPSLGFTSTFPSVIRTGGRSDNGNWYVVFGTGSTTMPKNNTDISRSEVGYVYFLDLKTGTLAKKVALDSTGVKKEIVADILGIDANKDYSSEALFFGTSYKPVGGTWKGRLIKIDVPASIDAAWTPVVTPLFDDDYPFTASVDAAKDVDGNIWLYAGSGKYLSDIDEADDSSQIILGMKVLPPEQTPGYPWTETSLADQTNAQTTGTVSGTQQVCGYDGSDFTMQTVATSISGVTTTGANAVTNGWYVTLNKVPGERVITRPLAVGGLVDFLTYAPSSDVCSYGGSSYLYAFSYTSGLAPPSIAIRANDGTVATADGKVSVSRGVLLGPGAPPTGEAIIIPPPKEGQEQLKKKIQIATGVIVEAENTPVISVISKIMHWLRK